MGSSIVHMLHAITLLISLKGSLLSETHCGCTSFCEYVIAVAGLNMSFFTFFISWDRQTEGIDNVNKNESECKQKTYTI